MTTGQHRQHGPVAPLQRAMSKVPEVTVYFWITKILTTGMGETTSDYLAHVLDPMIAVGIGGVALAASLALQFSVGRYVAWIYWTAVVMVSVFGTMAADVLHVGLGIPYAVSTPFFTVVLAVILVAWYASERTLSIHSIHTRRREAFYWATVMATFALGTAAGDMTAVTLHLGYFSSGVMFAALFAVPALAFWLFRLNGIFAFWFAYIVTRPFGASFADWMGVSHVRGGLAWGTGPVSLALAGVIAGFVGFLAVTRKDVARETDQAPSREREYQPHEMA
ncbi:putative membrane-anchored protein [Streptacidiphilus sp. MAP12-16]|uniref:COG4705 family protein n=1 Tax=Streptacidiphilus sp. MAP12-16 TaxID=3156300 RepID=UPI003512C431